VGSTRARNQRAQASYRHRHAGPHGRAYCAPANIQDRDGGRLCSPRSAFCIRGCVTSSPIAVTPRQTARRVAAQRSMDGRDHKRSTPQKASKFYRADGCRKNFRMAEPLPQTRQGLRGNDRKRRSMLFIAISESLRATRKALKSVDRFESDSK